MSRGTLLWCAKLGVAVAILVVLLARADLGKIASLMTAITYPVLALVSGLQCLSIVVATAKWNLLLPGRSFGLLLRLNMMSQFFSLIVPGQVGAEAIKAYQLGRGNVDAEAVAASVLLDKLTGLLALLLLGAAGMLLSAAELSPSYRWTWVGASLLATAGLFALRFRAVGNLIDAATRRLSTRLPAVSAWGARLALFMRAWNGFLRRVGVLFASIGAGCIGQLTSTILVLVIAQHLGAGVALADWLWIFALVSIASIAPFTIGGLGVREGTLVGVLSLFGVATETALAISIWIFAIHLATGLVGAMVFAFWRGHGGRPARS